LTEARSDFWSRRKARVQQEAEGEALQEARLEEAAQIATREAEAEEKTDAEILAELDLPDPDTLQKGDDFSVFLKQAVPERIRRRALRRLWTSNPVLANLDALVDYGEDYTDAARVVENLSTTYQVGKGMLAHVQEMERKAAALLEAEDAADDAPAEDAPTEDDDDAGLAAVDLSEDDAAIPEPDVTAQPDMPRPALDQDMTEQVAVLPPRKRMRFAFADSGADV